MKTHIVLLFTTLLLILSSCNNSPSGKSYEGRDQALERIDPADFQSLINGKETKLFTLENENGMIVRLTNFGASMVQVIFPDKKGNFDDVILGYNSVEGYLNDDMSQGCIVGRYANRIARGKFVLNGKEYTLTVNNGLNSLHGGPGGIHSKVWDAEKIPEGVKFSVVSPHMEEGYPGELTVSVEYVLNKDNELSIHYTATTSDSTFINLTNHTYWNLDGEAVNDILQHQIKIAADFITPVDTMLIPTGDFMNVEGTPFDLREFTLIGAQIDSDHPQIVYGKGYDHNFVLAENTREKTEFAAALYSEKSGRLLEVYTTEPGIQFYSGNFMDGTVTGKNGELYAFRHGTALEAQHFPDSPNQPNFPSTLLVPGEKYTQTTVYKLSVK